MRAGRAFSAWPSTLNAALVGLSAAIWVASVYLNNEILFVWTQKEEYLHWIFVPAGIKILLVMLLGWRGAFGIVLGTLPRVLEIFPGIGPGMAVLIATGAGLIPLLVLWTFSLSVGIRHPWHNLVWWHLPVLAVFSAFASSAFFNLLLLLLGLEPAGDLPENLLLVTTSHFLGTLLLLLSSVVTVRFMRVLRSRPN